MKNLFIIPLLLITFSIKGQDDRFTAGIHTEPYAYDDGFNIGASIEYQMRIMYLKAQVFYFPDLNGNTYFDFEGTLIGFHFRDTPFDTNRLYAGFKVGLIKRFGTTYPKVGFECGYDYYFNDKIYVGIMPSYDYRTDGKGEDVDIKPYWRLNNAIRVGFIW